jgi:methionine-S-sulfoxide reductase
MAGVIRTRVGYAGGTKPNPTYHSLGDHTEVLQIDFDPRQVSYEALLGVFWKAHDPASRSWSRQYMAAVFYHSEAQRQAAEASKARLQAARGQTIQTPILPVGRFTRAEDYHQKYYLRQESLLMREFGAMYPRDEDFVDSTAAARANGFVAGEGTAADRDAALPRMGLSPEALRGLQAR